VDESLGEEKIEKVEELRKTKIEDLLQQSVQTNNKNEALLDELFSRQKKQMVKKSSEQQNSEQSDQEDTQPGENKNLSNILQMMQNKQENGNADLSEDEEQTDEEDEESMSEEEKFAAMLNNSAQLQQLLLSSANNSTPSTSNNSKIMNLYEELMGQQSAKERNEQSPSNQVGDDANESEISDYERFSRAVQQQQLLQQLQQQDKLSNKLMQQQARKPSTNAIYTKLYQCNICEYNTRWLSNLYAHEKRRHNTCSSSQGNLKVITIRRDIPSPNQQLMNSSPPFRSNTQLSLSNLLNGLENSNKLLTNQQQQSNNNNNNNRLENDIINQLSDLDSNPNSFVNQLLQSNETKATTRPVKERPTLGDRKYTCSICQRTYCHKHSLQRHLACHRESGSTSKTNQQQDNQSPSIVISPKQEQSSPQSNDLNSNNNLFTQPSNGTSTPSFSTGRSSVDSVISGEHNLKQQQNNQLANQMFGSLNQEMLESLISGSNSSLLGNLITGNHHTQNVHSPNNNASTYSNSVANDNSTTTTTNTPTSNATAAMFSV